MCEKGLLNLFAMFNDQRSCGYLTFKAECQMEGIGEVPSRISYSTDCTRDGTSSSGYSIVI